MSLGDWPKVANACGDAGAFGKNPVIGDEGGEQYDMIKEWIFWWVVGLNEWEWSWWMKEWEGG